VGWLLLLFTPCHSPCSFLRNLFKDKSFYFYYLPALCSAATTASSSSLHSLSLATPLDAPLHAHSAFCTRMAKKSAKKQAAGWTSTALMEADLKKVKKEGFLVESAEVIFPSTEVISAPLPGFRVMFLVFFLCGFSLPAHEFLHGILFVYGVQLHQLTPNSLLHIAFFIMLCEAFLGVEPHWVLWKYLFRLRPSGSKDEIPKLGGAIVSVRSESQYLAFKMA
jgi:hypothetical protein